MTDGEDRHVSVTRRGSLIGLASVAAATLLLVVAAAVITVLLLQLV